MIVINAIISVFILCDKVNNRNNSVSMDVYKKANADFYIASAQFDTAIALGHKACQQRNAYKRQLDSINVTLEVYKRAYMELKLKLN